jgi:hypothetical protein
MARSTGTGLGVESSTVDSKQFFLNSKASFWGTEARIDTTGESKKTGVQQKYKDKQIT